MLTFFIVKSQFHKLKATMTVDLDDLRAPKVSLVLAYDRRIVVMEDLRAADAYSIRSPQEAEKYLSRQVQVTADGTMGFVEAMERRYRLESLAA